MHSSGSHSHLYPSSERNRPHELQPGALGVDHRRQAVDASHLLRQLFNLRLGDLEGPRPQKPPALLTPCQVGALCPRIAGTSSRTTHCKQRKKGRLRPLSPPTCPESYTPPTINPQKTRASASPTSCSRPADFVASPSTRGFFDPPRPPSRRSRRPSPARSVLFTMMRSAKASCSTASFSTPSGFSCAQANPRRAKRAMRACGVCFGPLLLMFFWLVSSRC